MSRGCDAYALEVALVAPPVRDLCLLRQVLLHLCSTRLSLFDLDLQLCIWPRSRRRDSCTSPALSASLTGLAQLSACSMLQEGDSQPCHLLVLQAQATLLFS